VEPFVAGITIANIETKAGVRRGMPEVSWIHSKEPKSSILTELCDSPGLVRLGGRRRHAKPRESPPNSVATEQRSHLSGDGFNLFGFTTLFSYV
jgi:hypothetical protein